MATNDNETMQRFYTWLKGTDLNKVDFCCDYHKNVVVGMKERAVKDQTLSMRQRDFALAIVKRNVNCRDQEVVTAKCTKRFKNNKRCNKEFQGTRREIGQAQNQCKTHRPKVSA